MIELKEVTKEYSKGIAALNGINLRIEQGEFVFVVGDSGSGKSTLIRLLMKEIEPTSGTIIVNGQNLNRMKHRQIPQYRRGIGVVFQNCPVENSRELQLPEQLSMSLLFCWLMSRQETWIQPTHGRS